MNSMNSIVLFFLDTFADVNDIIAFDFSWNQFLLYKENTHTKHT